MTKPSINENKVAEIIDKLISTSKEMGLDDDEMLKIHFNILSVAIAFYCSNKNHSLQSFIVTLPEIWEVIEEQTIQVFGAIQEKRKIN